MAKSGSLGQVGYLLAWLLLTLLTTAAAWQLHITILYLAILLIENPTWRPTGWSTGTLAGVSKLSILTLGSLWLIFVLYLEYNLREALREGTLVRKSSVFGMILLIMIGVGYLLTRL